MHQRFKHLEIHQLGVTYGQLNAIVAQGCDLCQVFFQIPLEGGSLELSWLCGKDDG